MTEEVSILFDFSTSFVYSVLWPGCLPPFLLPSVDLLHLAGQLIFFQSNTCLDLSPHSLHYFEMIFSVATTLSLLCFATGVLSSPLSSLRRRTTRKWIVAYLDERQTHVHLFIFVASVPDISFDNWGGLSSLSGFDNF